MNTHKEQVMFAVAHLTDAMLSTSLRELLNLIDLEPITNGSNIEIY